MYNFSSKRRTNRSMRRIISIIALVIMLCVAACAISGCEGILTRISTLRGELIGNDYVISQFDNYGNKVLEVSGDKVAMETVTDNAGEDTSYINITIDGYEWRHVGSTLVFAQNGVDMITDFALPESIETHGSTSSGLIGVDRFINNYRNNFGKELVVLVSSQNGTPIGLFRGDSCYTEVPSNLPKTTLIHIDGKIVYVHRANVDLIPAKMFEG